MLLYLYTLDYSPLQVDDEDSNAKKLLSIYHHIDVYMIADKYDIPELQQLASEKFRSSLKCGLSMAGLQQVVKLVLETTPSSNNALRDHMVQVCASQRSIRCLIIKGSSQEWEDILRMDADFLLEVVKKVAKTTSSMAAIERAQWLG